MPKKSQSKDITTVLADVASAVVGQFDMEALLHQSIDSAMKALNTEVCSIFLEDKELARAAQPAGFFELTTANPNPD